MRGHVPQVTLLDEVHEWMGAHGLTGPNALEWWAEIAGDHIIGQDELER